MFVFARFFDGGEFGVSHDMGYHVGFPGVHEFDLFVVVGRVDLLADPEVFVSIGIISRKLVIEHWNESCHNYQTYEGQS